MWEREAGDIAIFSANWEEVNPSFCMICIIRSFIYNCYKIVALVYKSKKTNSEKQIYFSNLKFYIFTPQMLKIYFYNYTKIKCVIHLPVNHFNKYTYRNGYHILTMCKVRILQIFMRKYSNDSKSLPNNFNINHTNTVVFKYLHIQTNGEYLWFYICVSVQM